MDYLLFNSDGSIKQSNLNQYVQEGDNNKKVLVKVEGLETGTELAQAICRLPNGQSVVLAGVWNEDEHGWIFTFTSSVTLYYGVVLVAIRISENGINRVMFPFSLMVNQTGVNPNTDTGISLEELDAYLLTIKNWIDTTQSIEFPIEDGQWEGFIQSLQTETPRIGFLTEEQKAIIKNYNVIQLTIPAYVTPYLGLRGEHKFKMLKRDAFSGSGENENYIMFDIFHDNGVIISFGFREDVNALYINKRFNLAIWKHTLNIANTDLRLIVFDRDETAIGLQTIQRRTLDSLSYKLINRTNNKFMQLVDFPMPNIRYINENGVIQEVPITLAADIVEQY